MFDAKRTYDPQLRTIADECTLQFIVLRHFCVHVCYRHLVKDGVHTAEKGKQHDNADVTFRIVPTTDENWQARSDLSESVCS